MTYAERFYLAALQVAPVEKCVHLADPEMNLFLKPAFANTVNFTKYINEFNEYAHGISKEPWWHQQAREVIESQYTENTGEKE